MTKTWDVIVVGAGPTGLACGIEAARAGRRELIAYRLAEGESETAWVAFLQDLFLRGLEGSCLKLVITRIVFGVFSHLNGAWEKNPLKRFTDNA